MNIKGILTWTAGVAALLVAGCKDMGSGVTVDANVVNKSNSTTYVVTVGMERSMFAGPCSGAGYDAQRMTALFRQYTPNVKAFSSETATKTNVRAAMIEAAEKADLFIFYYSGHGGQQKFTDTGSDEVDGQDEFLCLYDTFMRDNEIWSIITKAKGRVFMCFDACHSETMYRTVSPMTMKRCIPVGVTHYKTEGAVKLQVWSGCPENTVSWGSAAGGKFTNCLLKYFDSRKTYDYLWNEIENDTGLKVNQIVQRTIMGSSFAGRPVFQ